ncbi:phosphotransferase [Candidatus Uhrbacteria bacterium]|nr:phosphotransferase [Candidatus Uhrbacteria bacterium]
MRRQFEITKDNLHEFLRSFVQPRINFAIEEILKRDEVSKYSNNNYLWRVVVKTPRTRRVLFVKQAREHNKRAWETKGEKHYVDPLRICGEYQIMKLLAKLWGKEYVPEIYYFDPVHCVLVMSDVGGGGSLLVEEFEQGRVHPELGALFGRLFGKLHANTYETKQDCCGSPAWRKKIISFFGGWWLGQGIAKFVPRQKLNAFYREVNCAPRAWIWGDPVYRNIFIKPHGRASMVDFDHTVAYDPAFDCGILTAHWMWMGLKNAKLKIENEKFQRDFWRVYEKQFPPLRLRGGEEGLRTEVDGIKRRALRWAGIYLVSRTDGRSGSYFKKWPRWEKKIRALGIILFNENSKI